MLEILDNMDSETNYVDEKQFYSTVSDVTPTFSDYDYDPNEGVIPPEDLIPTSVIYGLTLIIGILGNSLIIFTISKYRRMRTITNVFLASLATADLLLILICVPVKMAKLFSFSWTFGEFLCKFVHYMQNVSAICSVLTMTSMSLERYYAILHPMKAKYICTISQARRVIMMIWCLSFLFAIPILFVQIHMEVGHRIKAYWCVHTWDDVTLYRCYTIYMLSLILIIPACIMGFAYTMICKEVWQVMQMRATMIGGELRNGSDPPLEMRNLTVVANGPHHVHRTRRTGQKKSDDDNATVKQVIKMLVAVILLFIICWTPLLVSDVLTSFDVIDRLNYGYLKPMRMMFHLMAYFNSCVNPIVYGFMSKNFRDSFMVALCLCRHGRSQRQMSFTQTRTTSVSLGRSLSVSTTTY